MTTSISPSLGRREHRRLARLLHAAQGARRNVESLTVRYPEMTAADAREIRDELVSMRLDDGERLVGAKAAVGDDGELQLGWLTDAMLVADHRAARGTGRTAERKLAVVLDRTPDAIAVTAREVLATVGGLRTCTELVPSVARDPIHAVASNLGTDAVVLGPTQVRRAGTLDEVVEPLLWLARRCTDGESRVGALAATQARLILVLPPLDARR